MGQAIMVIQETRTLVAGELCIIFQCDACHAHADVYTGTDFILMRTEAHADGWRRRNNKWFKGDCTPKGTDDAD